MKKLRGNCKVLVCMVLCLAFALTITPQPALAEGGGETGVAASSFAFAGHSVSWDFAYNLDGFRLPSDEYNHELATLSLGMALAAFRNTKHAEAQDDHLLTFLKAMGFEQIETDTYDESPTPYSVSYGIAQRRLIDMTVVALAVCGGNYGVEWASNLTVGHDVRTEGFADASLKVQKALKTYMERHPLEGVGKLWITGFSRGGAVANIVAADCTDSDAFEDVYGYTFASPRTTREPGYYPNIFNIVRKDDTVPRIPLADWNYKRYGTDLFLVSRETDTDSEAVMEQTEALYREMIGSEMVKNSEINYQLRIVMDYLYMLMQDSATYEKYLQPLLLDLMTNDENTMDALLILLRALEHYKMEDRQHRKDLRALREYLSTLVEFYYLQDESKKLPADQWDPQFGNYNLFNEHFPAKYLAEMLASDDPRDIFSENTKYIRLVIYGDTDVQILKGDIILKEVLADGTELVDGVEARGTLPYVNCQEDKTVITLPADQSYTVSVLSRASLPQTVTYTGLLFSGDTVRAEADDLYSYLMNPGETAEIVTSTNGRAIEPENSDHMDVSAYVDAIYSPTTAMRLETNPVMYLTVSGFINKILVILVLLFVQMIVSGALALIRKKQHRKRSPVIALIWHGTIAAAFALTEMAMWYFVPTRPQAKLIPGILVMLVIAVYALKGYLEYRQHRKALFILMGALIVFGIAENLLIGDFAAWKTIIMQIFYAGFTIAAFILLWRARVSEDPAAPTDSADDSVDATAV